MHGHEKALFDLPAPVLDWADGWAATFLPSWLRLVIWGLLAASSSMLLYRWLSPQESIRLGKEDLRQAQRRLNSFDGELNEAWPLMHHLLRIAIQQVGRVGGPSLVASFPLLFLLCWLGTAYGYHFPKNDASIQVQTVPRQFNAKWMQPNGTTGAMPHLLVSDEKNHIVVDAPVPVPVPVFHKHRWWNLLIGNPVGYLPNEVPVDSIKVSLPRQHHIAFGPEWLRGWEFVFFASLVTMSAALKMILRIA